MEKRGRRHQPALRVSSRRDRAIEWRCDGGTRRCPASASRGDRDCQVHPGRIDGRLPGDDRRGRGAPTESVGQRQEPSRPAGPRSPGSPRGRPVVAKAAVINPLGPVAEALNSRSVRYVLIGVYGANLYAPGGQSVFITDDADLVFRSTPTTSCAPGMPVTPAGSTCGWAASLSMVPAIAGLRNRSSSGAH
jgi:hypothetical protein